MAEKTNELAGHKPALKNLKALRRQQKLSLRGLAERSGVSHGTVRYLESSTDHRPNKLTVRALSQALEVSPQELRGE